MAAAEAIPGPRLAPMQGALVAEAAVTGTLERGSGGGGDWMVVGDRGDAEGEDAGKKQKKKRKPKGKGGAGVAGAPASPVEQHQQSPTEGTNPLTGVACPRSM